jgi:hypothetical protein
LTQRRGHHVAANSIDYRVRIARDPISKGQQPCELVGEKASLPRRDDAILETESRLGYDDVRPSKGLTDKLCHARIFIRSPWLMHRCCHGRDSSLVQSVGDVATVSAARERHDEAPHFAGKNRLSDSLLEKFSIFFDRLCAADARLEGTRGPWPLANM